MLDLNAIKDLDVRQEHASKEGYTVASVTLASPDEHEDLYSAVIKTPYGEFYRIHFIHNHRWDEDTIYDYNVASEIRPTQVWPQEVTTIRYMSATERVASNRNEQ